MYLIELSNYTLTASGTGNGLRSIYFALSKGDACSIHADSADDANLLLKALATLVSPACGTYCFGGEKINLSDYRNALPCKRKIGYIAPDAAMISNKTVRENLLFMQYYFENSLSLDLDEYASGLCDIFNIRDKLDFYPTELKLLDLRMAIAVRELSKAPDVLLLERPEDFVDYTKFDLFMKILKEKLLSKIPIVFISNDIRFVETFSNKKILIDGGTLTTACD